MISVVTDDEVQVGKNGTVDRKKELIRCAPLTVNDGLQKSPILFDNLKTMIAIVCHNEHTAGVDYNSLRNVELVHAVPFTIRTTYHLGTTPHGTSIHTVLYYLGSVTTIVTVARMSTIPTAVEAFRSKESDVTQAAP